MSVVFTLLFLASLTLLGWGLLAPKSLARHASRATKRELTRKHFAIVFGTTLVITAVLGGIVSPSNAQQGAPAAKPVVQTQPKKPTLTYKTVTQTKPVAFTVTTVNDSSLAQGTTKITTTGANGVETLTYKVTYTDGQQTAKDLVSDQVTTQPVTQVTHVGTYVAPAAPVATPTYTAPASTGARTGAVCNDGSPSTATGRGACSHHHGVAYWTY